MPRQPMSEAEFEIMKNRILKTAAAIVGETSLAELSMRTLGQRVGLTPGALYRYFPSKQELLYAYWDSALKDLGERIATISATEPDALKAIRSMFIAYAEFCLDDHDRFRMIFLENDQTLAGQHMQLQGGLAPYDILLARVSEAVKQGIFISDDARLIAQAMWAAAHGAVCLLITVTEMPLAEPETLLHTTIDAMMRGLVARKL